MLRLLKGLPWYLSLKDKCRCCSSRSLRLRLRLRRWLRLLKRQSMHASGLQVEGANIRIAGALRRGSKALPQAANLQLNQLSQLRGCVLPTTQLLQRYLRGDDLVMNYTAHPWSAYQDGMGSQWAAGLAHHLVPKRGLERVAKHLLMNNPLSSLE